MEYHILSGKELRLICRERGVQYISCMNKAEMVYILQRNDDDPSIKVHIIIQDREREKNRLRRGCNKRDPDKLQKSTEKKYMLKHAISPMKCDKECKYKQFVKGAEVDPAIYFLDCQCDSMVQTKYVTEPSEFHKMIADDNLYELDIECIDEDTMKMTYILKDQFVDNA